VPEWAKLRARFIFQGEYSWLALVSLLDFNGRVTQGGSMTAVAVRVEDEGHQIETDLKGLTLLTQLALMQEARDYEADMRRRAENGL